MPLLTVFSAPKPFIDSHTTAIQSNAIRSWLQLRPEVEIFLVGEEAGLVDAAEEFGVSVLGPVTRNSSGTPLVSSIFALAEQESHSQILAYVNADIILFSDILQAIRKVSQALNSGDGTKSVAPFLMIGQRWDIETGQPLVFNQGWEKELISRVHECGKLHPPAGSDYFVFPRRAISTIPDFAIGRAGWDNWMIYHARKQGWPIIDATPSVMVVHQNHDYRHLPGGLPHYDHHESKQNMAIAGGLSRMYMVLDSTHQLKNGRLQRPSLTRLRVLRTLERWLMPEKNSLRGLRGGLARRFRRMRRGVD